ncbi:hypothetical protein DL96DRAFT_1812064 [Flagelloscypha sp. PMI_526]|nr:hypothetical protein DL96DRAFT_1812064 [Flagelloscypha sp. PMI_526]
MTSRSSRSSSIYIMKFSAPIILATYAIVTVASPAGLIKRDGNEWAKFTPDLNEWEKRKHIAADRGLGDWNKREHIAADGSLDWTKREDDLAPYKRDDDEDVSLLK